MKGHSPDGTRYEMLPTLADVLARFAGYANPSRSRDSLIMGRAARIVSRTPILR
jgi:hypothetical protein